MKRIFKYVEEHKDCINKGEKLLIGIEAYYIVSFLFMSITSIFNMNQNTYSAVYLKIICLVFMSLLYVKQRSKSNYERWQNKKMSIKSFLLLLSLIMSVDVVPMLLIKAINILRGMPDAIIAGTVENIGIDICTIIRVVLIAPVVEEILFRGLGLVLFKKQDNKFEAIIFTSIVFGLMHANLPQAMGATISGFIYGYAAIQYGLKYSILFHMLGNALCYIQYAINNEWLIYITSIIILFIWTLNIKTVMKKLTIRLNNGNKYSLKRQVSYFLHPMLLLFEITWIILIIVEGL